MISNAISPSKAWRVMNNHFLPPADANINLYEHQLNGLKMKQGEDPHVFLLKLSEVLSVLLMLGVEKEERAVCSLMLRGLTSEYEMVRSAMI
ncbi:unnamed protein product, partial [Sphacelaria rigidula]